MSMTRAQFPLFQSHIDLAHAMWAKLITPGDTIIDATCGNGHDTLQLCRLAPSGHIFALDVQQSAIDATSALLDKELPPEKRAHVTLIKQCHSQFPSCIASNSVRLIVYNLGYLPGGDKQQTTLTTTTLKSLVAAQSLLMPGGVISLTCYPGHKEGEIETAAIQEALSCLSPFAWSCSHTRWINRVRAPQLFLIQRPNV